MVITKLEEFDPEERLYLRTMVEDSDVFDQMEDYFNKLDGYVEEADINAYHREGNSREHVTLKYTDETEDGYKVKMSFSIRLSNTEIEEIEGSDIENITGSVEVSSSGF